MKLLSDEAELKAAEPRAAVRSAASAKRTALGWLANSDVHQGLMAVLDQAVVSGTTFATTIVIGRLCSHAEVGVYALAWSITLFARGLQEQLVSAPYLILCNRRQGASLEYYAGSSLVHQFVVMALVNLVMLGFIGCLSLGMGPVAVAPTAWVLIAALPFILLREYIRGIAMSHLRPQSAIAIDVAVAVLQLAGLLLLGFHGYLTVAVVFAVMGGACAVALLAWLAIDRPRWRFSRSAIREDWRQNWSLGRWALASHLLGCSTIYLMPWVMVFARGEEETGVLAVCTTLVGMAGMFVIGLGNFVSPRSAQAFAQGGVLALRPVLWKTTLVFVTTVGAFCILMLLAGGWIVAAVYGSTYAGSGAVVEVLALSLLARCMGMTASNGLWAMGKPQANFWADGIGLGVTLLVTIYAVQPLGALGAAIGALVGNVVGSAVRSFTLWQLMASGTSVTEIV